MTIASRLAAAYLALLATLPATSALPEEQLPMNGALQEAFDAGELDGLHNVLVTLKGETLAEIAFPGADERWGRPLGLREHGADTLHDLRSVTKSVVGLLYGIALGEGKVPSVDAPLLAQFPDYRDLRGDPLRDEITVGHALSMTMGTEWSEDLPYSDPRNSEVAMEMAKDRYRFVLDRPMVAEPGSSWTYNGGATAIVARLIAKGTGMSVDAYAKEKLFAPLGIDTFEWIRGADGEPSAASGLRLNAGDLARIGQLVLDGGRHDGRQIVPAEWLSEAFTPRTSLDELRYGYQWWLSAGGTPPDWVAGFGNGGQRLTVQESIGLVVVVYAGNYNKPDAWKIPVKVIMDFVAPAVRKRHGR